MTSKSPQTPRAREIFTHNGQPSTIQPNAIGPGTFSDGQPRMGINQGTIHHDQGHHYDHAHGHAYRDDLRERPSAKPHRSFAKR
jgi:hypothetical protein